MAESNAQPGVEAASLSEVYLPIDVDDDKIAECVKTTRLRPRDGNVEEGASTTLAADALVDVVKLKSEIKVAPTEKHIAHKDGNGSNLGVTKLPSNNPVVPTISGSDSHPHHCCSRGTEPDLCESTIQISTKDKSNALEERQSYSPVPSSTSSDDSCSRVRIPPSLVSSFKTPPSSSGSGILLSSIAKKHLNKRRTKRRVRGIWGSDDNDSSLFSQFHDETILRILRYLSMRDLSVSSMVCQRWKHLALSQDLWKWIDASDFVQDAHAHYLKHEEASMRMKTDLTSSSAATAREDRLLLLATKSTSLALASRMERFSPISLSIHSIQNRLSADNFYLSIPSLQELTLTSFEGLTDTHLHVLLLSLSCKNVQARSKQSCILRKLVLDHCPLLTDATVQSIGKLCPELEELSLQGNLNIQDLSQLKDLWTLVKKPVPKLQPPLIKTAPQSAPQAVSSLSMLFGPPPTTTSPPTSLSMLFGPPPTSKTTTPTAASLFATTPPPPPTTPRPSTPTNSLQSLFALPGDSPPRSSNVISALPRSLSKGSKTKQPGKLRSINLSQTNVTLQSLVTAWKSLPSDHMVRLNDLVMNGTGESWNDQLLQELVDFVDVAKLQKFEIGCGSTTTSASIWQQKPGLTDKGLSVLTGAPTANAGLSLTTLNLTGHSLLSGSGIADLIKVTSTSLRTLILDGCKGISIKTRNPAHDFKQMDALAKAILKCTIAGSASKNSICEGKAADKGLRYLSLARCFSSQRELALHRNGADVQAFEETLGTHLLGALQKSSLQDTASPTLGELDLTDCWFVTGKDVSALRKRCPRLTSIHLEGTRAAPGKATCE